MWLWKNGYSVTSSFNRAGLNFFKVAKRLAEAHRKEDPDTKAVYLAPAPANEIRLVEISGSVGATREAMPFRFAPQGDIPYPSTVVLLSPEDWERVKKGTLKLPKGWGSWDYLKKIG